MSRNKFYFLMAAVAWVMVAIIVIASSSRVSRMYPLAVTVAGFDFESDSVIFEDGSGEQWLYRGIEDWMIGDRAACLMDSCGTEDIYDDLILTARYGG